MQEYDTIMITIEKLLTWHNIVFSAACAERIAPVLYRLGTPKSRDIFQSGLHLVWNAILLEKYKHELHHIKMSIETSPEAHIDDSYSPLYYAMRAMSILADCLNAFESNDSKKAAMSSCIGMLNLTADFDFMLRRMTPHITIQGTQGELFSLEACELTAQQQVLEILVFHKFPSIELINYIRHQAQQFSESLHRVLPQIFKYPAEVK